MRNMTLAAFVAVCILQSAVLARAGELPRKTANYYKALAEQNLGKEVVIDVTHVTPEEVLDLVSIPDHTVLIAHTYNQAYGGWIHVAVPNPQAESFLKRFGTSTEFSRPLVPKTKPLKGILKKTGKGISYILYPQS